MAAIGPLSGIVAAHAGQQASSAALGAVKDMLAGAPQLAPQSAAPAIPAPSLESVLAAILTATGGKPALASLLTDLQALAGKADIPAQVRDAAKALLAIKADAGDARVDANAIKNAASGSADLKAALFNLRDALKGWSSDSNTKIAQSLIDKTDNAIARSDLVQVASTPDAQPDKPLRLVFDIPMQAPHGETIAQMAVERDGKENADDPEQTIWRASFNIDLPSLGPVHASIAMQAGRAAVTLLAERADSAKALHHGLPMLEAAFGEANVEPGDLEARQSEAKRAAGPGILMDRAT
jgi:hypothetical protein